MKCIICEDMLAYEYTNLNGEVGCLICGATYTIENEKPVTNIKDEFIPLLKEYWNKTHGHSGIGGDLFGPKNKYKENKEKFDRWLRTENEFVSNSRTFYPKEMVFDEPLIQKLSSQIATLQQDIAFLKSTKEDFEKKILSIQKENKSSLELYEKDEQLKHLNDYLKERLLIMQNWIITQRL